jgi:hypothetical protein
MIDSGGTKNGMSGWASVALELLLAAGELYVIRMRRS